MQHILAAPACLHMHPLADLPLLHAADLPPAQPLKVSQCEYMVFSAVAIPSVQLVLYGSGMEFHAQQQVLCACLLEFSGRRVGGMAERWGGEQGTRVKVHGGIRNRVRGLDRPETTCGTSHSELTNAQ